MYSSRNSRTNPLIKRIFVIGTSGCGKSTLARRLSERLSLPYFASDDFYWEPNWKAASIERVEQELLQVVQQDAWVLDGNFDDQRAWAWTRANCLVWLDYPLLTVLSRVTARNLRWALTRQPTWSGNHMTFRRAFSGIRHALRTHPLKRRVYPNYMLELSGVEVHRFQENRQVETWLAELSQGLDVC
jgi:shikimate kinase